MYVPGASLPEKITAFITPFGEDADGAIARMDEIHKSKPRAGRNPAAGVFELAGIDDDLQAQMDKRAMKVRHLDVRVEPSIGGQTQEPVYFTMTYP